MTHSQAQDQIYTNLNLELHPAGKHTWDNELQQKSKGLLNPQKFNTSWDIAKSVEITTGKINLNESGLLVVDIDNDASFSKDDYIISFHLFDRDWQLPITKYTQTTTTNKFHFYYRLPKEHNNRIVKAGSSNIDIFTGGVVFEWHSFSPNNEFHLAENNLEDIPSEFFDAVCDHTPKRLKEESLTLRPNHIRANIVKKYLTEELTQKELHLFFKMVIPRAYLPKTQGDNPRIKSKIVWKDFSMSYNLLNGIAVRLSTTSQLDTEEHTLPTLHKIIEQLTQDSYNPTYTDTILHKQVMRGLPYHEAITTWDEGQIQTLEEALIKQTGTIKLVRTISSGTILYVRIDAITLKPMSYDNSYLLTKTTASTLHPEFLTDGDKGPVWDDSLIPIVEVINNIYMPRSYINEDNNLDIVLNTYTPSRYLSEAQPIGILPNNVWARSVTSMMGIEGILNHRETGETIPADDYYHHWMAKAMFSDSPPSVKLWMAGLETLGGAVGKSVTGIDMPSKIAPNVVVQQTNENISKGWGDNIVNARVVSLEDLEPLKGREFNGFYGVLKRIGGNSTSRLNMKGKGYQDVRLQLGMTISSNWRPPLPQADRWIVALEPAHSHGYVPNISDEDKLEISKRIADSKNHDEDLQDLVNYWNYLYLNSTKYMDSLTTWAPHSVYRKLWVVGGLDPSVAIVPALNDPEQLLSLIKENPYGNPEMEYLMFLVANWNEDTHKTSLPWQWFSGILKFIIADQYSDSHRSKKYLSDVLKIDFTNPGTNYTKFKTEAGWCNRNGLPDEWQKWAGDGYLIELPQHIIDEYKTKIKELQDGINE